MKNYLQGILNAKYFWLHLARAELKYKFRRSKLGILWTFLNPLLLTLLMSFVLGGLFNAKVKDYAPYVLSGLITWEVVVGAVMGGCNSILVSEPYIRQFKHPMAIYPLKTTLVNVVSFLIAFQSLFLWIIIQRPQNIPISLLAVPISVVFLFFMCWPITLVTSFINTKYRDFGQFMGIVMQAVWYMSPVYAEAKLFKAANLAFLVDYNPVTHILNLIRKPMLDGVFPSITDYLYTLGVTVLFYIIAIYKIKKQEKEMIFYL